VAGLDVFQHPLGFRMIFDRFPAYRFKVVDLFDFPFFRLRVVAGAFFVMLGTFAVGLVFGGDPDPDADGFGWWLHITGLAN